MFDAYRRIFQAPGAKGFAGAGFIARLPIAMAPIGIVAMLSQTHGTYWLAGAVAATFALTNALVSPQVSRLVDRLGQARVVAPAAAVSAVAFALLILATRLRWPAWTLFATGVFAAAMPSVPALVRARWTALFRDRPELGTAFAFESAADELVYIAGASLAVALSVSLFPEAGMLVAAVMLATGTAALLLQRGSEPAVVDAHGAPSTSAIRQRPVRIVTLALVFVGAIFATAEVSVVAITKSLGQAGAASPVIAVYAAGSFALGLVLGAMQRRMPLHRQLLIALAGVALTQVPLLLADSVPLLALTVFVSGIAISPTFITAFGLIAERVPERMLTEGVTWVMTGIGIGMALGAYLAGWVIDTWGARSGFAISIACGLAACLVVFLGQRTLGADSAAEGDPR